MKFTFLVYFIFLINLVFSQGQKDSLLEITKDKCTAEKANCSFYLVNLKNTNKRIKIDTNHHLTLRLDTVVFESNVKRIRHVVVGSINDCSDSIFCIDQFQELNYVSYKDKRKSVFEKKTLVSAKKTCYNTDKIVITSEVNYNALPRKLLFGNIATASFLTGLFVAPFVSKNSQTGKFDVQKYKKWVGYSFLTCSIALPLGFYRIHKSYELTTKSNNSKSKNLWYIEKDVK